MNSDTGEIARFNSVEEAKAAGFDQAIEEHEYKAIKEAPRAINVKRRSSTMKMRDKIMESYRKFVGMTHSHKKENDRRRSQIERGILQVT